MHRFARGVGGHRGSLALALFLGFLLRNQGFLSCLFGFAGLAGERFFDGLEDFSQIGLILLASLQFLVAVLDVGIELGQDLLALCTHLVELGALGVQAAFLGQQLRLLQVDIGFDIGQLAQCLVEAFELGQTGFAQVVVISEGSGELLGVLLVEQHLQVFLTPALIGGTGLNGDQALLFKFCAVEFFFLAI